MVKLTYCIRRRADLSEEEFYTYWLQQHAALVTRHARALGARRYVQSHTVAPDVNRMLQTSRGSLDAFDGITEVWWDSRAAFDAALASPEGRAAGRALVEDENHFIDFSRSVLFLTEEHEVFDNGDT